MTGDEWRPSRSQWNGPDGVVWRRQRRWLTEREARRFVTRQSGTVAIEHCSPGFTLTWLEPDERAAHWNTHIAGHVDGQDGHVTVNDRGITYHVSVWKDDNGNRLTLLSEMC